MGNKSRMFRSSMSGFNKEDVNKYIIDMNNEFSAKEDDYKAELASLKEKLALSAERLNAAYSSLSSLSELEERLHAAESAASDAEAKLAEKNEALLAAETRLEKALADADVLNKKLSETENELKTAIAELEEAKANVAATDTEDASETVDEAKPHESDSEKIRLYDEIRGNIGDILINANKNADEIVKDAERKAAELAQTSRDRAESAKRKLTVVTGRTVASLKKNAIVNADNYVREFKTYSDEILHMSRAMTTTLEKKYAELNSKMESCGNELEEGIKTVLRDFDKSCNSIKNGLNSETDK